MENLQNLNMWRNNLIALVLFMGVLSLTLNDIWQIIGVVIAIVSLIVGNVLNLIYMKKFKKIKGDV